MAHTPAYRLVYDNLKRKITDGTYAKGDLLPNEIQLEEIYGVSRTTVRKAIDMLSREGYILVKQGFGTQVINTKTVQNLNCFNSLSETLRQKGYNVGVAGVYVEEMCANLFLAEQFQAPVGTPLVCIYRTHLADSNPVAIAKNYILRELVPDIQQKQDRITSLYSFLRENYKISYTLAKDTIGAVNASYEEARILGVNPGEALLTVNRKCYIGDRVCELALVKILASKHEFEIYTRGE